MEFLAVIGAITCVWFLLNLVAYVFREWFGVEFQLPFRVIETAKEPDEHPCSKCLRWEECNGVDRDHCPLCKGQRG